MDMMSAQMNSSMNLPTRTHNTNLSDDALLLLDAIIHMNGWVADQMTQGDYRFHMNVTYDHGLADDDVEHVLEDLRKIGVLRRVEQEDGDGDAWFATEQGGRLWESERQPIWDRFVLDCEYSAPADDESQKYDAPVAPLLLKATEGNPFAVIRSPSLETVNHYRAVAEQVNLWRPRAGAERKFVCRMDFGWKVFEQMHVLCVPIKPVTEHYDLLTTWPDWAEYVRRRTWWRDLRELQSLLGSRG